MDDPQFISGGSGSVLWSRILVDNPESQWDGYQFEIQVRPLEKEIHIYRSEGEEGDWEQISLIEDGIVVKPGGKRQVVEDGSVIGEQG